MPVEVIDTIFQDDFRHTGGPFAVTGPDLAAWRTTNAVSMAPTLRDGLPAGESSDGDGGSGIEGDDAKKNPPSLEAVSDALDHLRDLTGNHAGVLNGASKLFALDMYHPPRASGCDNIFGDIEQTTPDEDAKWVLWTLDHFCREGKVIVETDYDILNVMAAHRGIPNYDIISKWDDEYLGYLRDTLRRQGVAIVPFYIPADGSVTDADCAAHAIAVADLAGPGVELIAEFGSRKFPIASEGEHWTDDELYPYFTAVLGTGKFTKATIYDDMIWARNDGNADAAFSHMAEGVDDADDTHVLQYTMLKQVADYSSTP